MLDVALTVAPERDGHGLKWTQLVRPTRQLAVSRRHRLAGRARVTPEEVSGEPLLVFRQRDYPEYWNLIMTWLRNQRHAPAIAEEYDGITSLLAAVESGLGIEIVTDCTARLASERIRLKALSSAPKPVWIAAGYRAKRAAEKPLAVFIEELRHAAQAVEKYLFMPGAQTAD